MLVRKAVYDAVNRVEAAIVGDARLRYAGGEATMFIPNGGTKQPQINAAVADVVGELSPWVRRIRYEIGQDWSGEWAIFFRVLLSDEASNRRNLREIGPRIVWRMSDKLDLPGLGLFPYFDFRSESEQAQLEEPAWA